MFVGMRTFFTGEWIKADLLVVWLEKHGIPSHIQSTTSGEGQEDDMAREVVVVVDEKDYERASQLFYAEREDEL
jgi:hypothetical protein